MRPETEAERVRHDGDDIIRTEAEVLEIARQVLGSPPVQTRGNSFLDRPSLPKMTTQKPVRGADVWTR